VDFALLGSLEVRKDGLVLALGGPRERALLAILLLNANEPLSTDRLVDELWGEHPPKAAVKTVQVYVSRLRKLLGSDAIVTRGPGYALRIAPDRIDAHRFEALAGEGRRALAEGDAATANRRLTDALSLWRGPPLSDFAYERFAQPHAARLDELRLTALEDRCEAALRCGSAAELIGELQALAARHPLRERLRRQLMLALYRSERPAEALDVYRDTRATLVEELGIEPSVDLQRLERAILEQDPALEQPAARLMPRGAGLFVGRDSELRVLLAALDRAEAGIGSVVLLAGEPGIGKTRLADEVAAHARDRGFAVLRGRCWEAGGAPPFWPWQQVLRASVRDADPDEVRRRLGRWGPELVHLLPEVREVLDDRVHASVGDPEALRFRLFDAVAAFLRARAADGLRTMIVLDDLHAGDEPSLRLLQFLAGAIADVGMIAVGAYRDTEMGPALGRVAAELMREPAVTRVSVDRLGRDDVAAYLRLSAGGGVSRQLVEAIHERTAGNPLFVAETVRLLVAEGRLDPAAVANAMPAGAREAIERRVGALSPQSRTALALASVLGSEFDPHVLARVAGDEVADALDAAIAAGLVHAAPGAPGLLRFSHSLVRDALYLSIPPRSRRQSHRRVAGEIERRHGAESGPHLAALAHHLFEAAAGDQAARYATRAARHATDRLAFEEAVRLYRMALEALGRDDAADGTRRCDLLLALGEAQARSGDDAGARATFLSAADVARGSGSGERLARAALGYGGRFVWTVMRGDPHVIPLLEEAIDALPDDDSELRARVLARLAAGPLKVRGDASRARRFALSAEAVAMARRLGDPAVLAWVLDGRKVAIWGPDTLEEHWATIAELRRIADEAGDPEQLVDAHICALIMSFERFDVSGFDAAYARADLAARELRQPGQRWLVAVMAPMHALLVGRLADAKRLIDAAFELGREAAPWNARTSALLQRFVLRSLEGRAGEVAAELQAAAVENPYYPVFQAALAALYADLGDTDRTRAAFDGLAADDFAFVPFDEEWLLLTSLLADPCGFLGDRRRAQILYERLEPYAHRVAAGATEIAIGSASRALGTLAATLGQSDAARHWFERAASENERAGALPWAAHARLGHARLLLAEGDRAAAERLAESASAIYEELGMDAWVVRCREALAGAPALERR
jgi:DNA-binding SARP family transcriptional activator/tetratricopeptide (TPR) repeat protein